MRTTRARVLITADTGQRPRRGVQISTFELKAAYVQAVEEAGGLPLVVCPPVGADLMNDLPQLMDALVITGGEFDLLPELYGKSSEGMRHDGEKPARTNFERDLLAAAIAQGIPVLGVCGGMQLLNVHCGGTLLVDIAAERPEAIDHEQPTSPHGPGHEVALMPGSALAATVGAESIAVNSTHHQAVDRVGSGLRVAATSPDGIIEAVEHETDPILGVQWHPELLADDACRKIYAGLTRAALARRNRST